MIVSPTPSGGPEGSKSLHQLARDGDIEGCRTLKKKLDLNCIFAQFVTSVGDQKPNDQNCCLFIEFHFKRGRSVSSIFLMTKIETIW